MKPILLALAMLTPAFAVQFDAEGFGYRLNGWNKDRTTVYEFTDAKYRTHMPTITETPGGGIFLSTQVDFLAFGSNGAISHIDLAFDRRGTLLSAQLRTTIGKKVIDTGMVRRPEAPVAPTPIEGQPAPVVPAFDATSELIVDLFNRYDIEMKKITEGKDAEKRDLLSRMSGGKDARSANLAAGLRHNLNLMLQHTR